MGIEKEIKLAPAFDGAERELYESFGSRPVETIKMHTVYYDTPNGLLQKGLMMLRRRSENGRTVWTLKRPSDGWREEIESKEDGLEAALSQIEKVCPLPRPLEPYAEAEFTRTAILYEKDGFSAEIAVDRGFIRSGEKSVPISEIELELKSGDADGLSELAKIICEKYALAPLEKSKAGRARELYTEVKSMKKSVDPFFIANELLNYCIRQGLVQFEIDEDKQILYTVTPEGEKKLAEQFGVDLSKPCAHVEEI